MLSFGINEVSFLYQNPNKMKLLKLLLVLYCISFFACAGTKLISYVDPGFFNVSYDTFLVSVNNASLETRIDVETALVLAFKEMGIKAYRAIRLFPPTRSYTVEQVTGKLNRYKIQAVLFINPGESGSISEYIPKYGEETKTEGSATIIGDRINYNETSKTSHKFGGFTVEKLFANFSASVLDVKTESKVWLAESQTGGNAFAGRQTIVESFCESMVEKLINDGVAKKQGENF